MRRLSRPGSTWWLAAAICLATGCAGLKPANVPLEQYDPNYGYRFAGSYEHREPGSAIVYLALSGGGTRAAAFAYGVMQELHATEVTVDGNEKNLLDEVDTVSGVSGGSFPAAYYGLFGDRIFEEFEPRFLRKNIQGALTLRLLRPWNLIRVFTPYLSRSEIASRYYNENVFDQATFATLEEAPGPRVHINATDLSSGERFTYNQDVFNLICSDLNALPISTAVASSSAVPVLLSPITLKNFAGSCGFEHPEWVKEAFASASDDPRRARSARKLIAFSDPETKKFIHLVDGGISDNLGLRPAIEFVTGAGGARKAMKVQGVKPPDHLILIVVNAETDPDPAIDLADRAPSFAALMNAVSGAQIRHNNFETLLLVRDMLRQWGTDLSTRGHEVQTHMINVSFDELEDEDERRYFKRIPTSFVLTESQVDRLIDAGRKLLKDSPDFQRMLGSLR